MNIIKHYNQLTVSNLQSTRLYLQGRPLLSLWAKKRRHQQITVPLDVELINNELTSDFIAIDCAGWFFADQQRHCTAIELMPQSSKYWNDIHFEYDYLTWHPTYLPDLPVLAYYSTYFKYSELNEFLTFCKIWSNSHSKVIIGLDPTKVKFNYLKFDLVNIVSDSLQNKQLRIINQQNFNLLFSIESI